MPVAPPEGHAATGLKTGASHIPLISLMNDQTVHLPPTYEERLQMLIAYTVSHLNSTLSGPHHCACLRRCAPGN